MAREIMVKRVGSGLFPAGPVDEHMLAEFAEGKVLKATLTQPRNKPHHDKYMALIRAIFPHQTVYPTFDMLLEQMKIWTGHCVEIEGRLFAQSIAFNKMGEESFREFYMRSTQIILERILPSVNRLDLEAEVEAIMAGRAA